MSENWLHISPSSGTGSTQIRIYSDPYPDTVVRKAKIIVTAGTMSRTIDVVQVNKPDIRCIYKVDSSSVKLFSGVDMFNSIRPLVILSTTGSSVTIDNYGILSATTEYSSMLGLQSGDTLTVDIYKTDLCPLCDMEVWFNEPEIPVTNIELNKNYFIWDGWSSGSLKYYFRNLPKLETIHFGQGFPTASLKYNSSDVVSLICNCPKLSAITGNSDCIRDNRTIIVGDWLVGYAPGGIEEYTIPSGVKAIASECFCYTTEVVSQSPLTVKKINIPDSVVRISSARIVSPSTVNDCPWFTNFNSLTSITIPSTIASGTGPYSFSYVADPRYAFSGCTALTSATIGLMKGAISTNLEYMFADCWSLTSVTFTGDIDYISSYQYLNCKSMQSFEIPSAVTGIGSYAFSGSTALTSITATRTTPPTVNSNTFKDVGVNGILSYPIDKYDYTIWLSTNAYYLGYYNWTSASFNPTIHIKACMNYIRVITGATYSFNIDIESNVVYNVVYDTASTVYSVTASPAYGTSYITVGVSNAVLGDVFNIYLTYNNYVYETITIDVTTSQRMWVSPSSITFNAGENGVNYEKTIYVNSTTQFSYEANNWLMVYGTVNRGMAKLNVYPRELVETQRTGTIDLKYGNSVYSSVTVTQKATQGMVSISIDPTDVIIAYDNTGSTRIRVVTNQTVLTTKYNCDAFQVPNYFQPGGTNTNYYIRALGVNNTYLPNKGYFTADKDGIVYETVTVTQLSKLMWTGMSVNQLTIEDDGVDKRITATSASNVCYFTVAEGDNVLGWRLAPNHLYDWYSKTDVDETRVPGGVFYTFAITLQPNTTGEERWVEYGLYNDSREGEGTEVDWVRIIQLG